MHPARLFAVSIVMVVACSRPTVKRCVEYDQAEALFNQLVQEHLDPDFGHPSFAKAAERFAKVPDRCARKDRARFLAEEIRRGLLAREVEEARQKKLQAEQDAQKRETQAKRSSYRRRPRRRPQIGSYCQYTVGGQAALATGLCYPNTSSHSARRRCERHLKERNQHGKCDCKRNSALWKRYCQK